MQFWLGCGAGAGGDDILGKRFFDLTKLPAFVGQLGREAEFSALAHSVGGEALLGVREATPILCPLLLEADKDMLEPGDCTERCVGDREFDFSLGSGAQQRRAVAVAVLAEALAGICELESAD